MTLFFGDPEPAGHQEELAYQATFSAAERIAKLIEVDVDDEEFFSRAVGIGAPVRKYDELAQLVESEGVTLDWAPKERPARSLTPTRASRHHARLNAPTEMVEWDLTVNGILYRIIAEPGAEQGTVGIRLFKWSGRPPTMRGGSLIVPYDVGELHQTIKSGLFGEAVEARIRARRPGQGSALTPGTSSCSSSASSRALGRTPGSERRLTIYSTSLTARRGPSWATIR